MFNERLCIISTEAGEDLLVLMVCRGSPRPGCHVHEDPVQLDGSMLDSAEVGIYTGPRQQWSSNIVHQCPLIHINMKVSSSLNLTKILMTRSDF